MERMKSEWLNISRERIQLLLSFLTEWKQRVRIEAVVFSVLNHIALII